MVDQAITSLNVTALKVAIGAHGLKPKDKKPDLHQMIRDCMTMTKYLALVNTPVVNANQLFGLRQLS
jgi:hypothetical protein